MIVEPIYLWWIVLAFAHQRKYFAFVFEICKHKFLICNIFFCSYLCCSRRKQWHPTPVLLSGKSHGWRSLVGCSPWGREESDTTERLHFYFSLSCIGEGNGNPLQGSWLENSRDGGAWWAAVCGVAQSWTRLRWLSSSSSSSVAIAVHQCLEVDNPLSSRLFPNRTVVSCPHHCSSVYVFSLSTFNLLLSQFLCNLMIIYALL